MPQPLLIHTEASRGWGGQEMRTLAEARWFRDHDYRVEFIARPDAGLTEAAEKLGFTVHKRLLRKNTQLADFSFCRKLFKELRPHMIGTHSNIDSRVCLAAATFAGFPHRIRYRHVSIPVKPSPWNHIIYRKFATKIVTTAESIAEPLRKHFKLSEDNAVSVPTGIAEPENLISRDDARAALIKELELPDETRFIGQVSVLRGWKGHHDVMTAFDKIHRDHPNHHLIFAGGGPGLVSLPRESEQYSCFKKIHFLGHRDDPWPIFRALEIATLASTKGEGVPQSGMQAMLSGSAFVGTTVGGIPEIIEDDVSGILVPPEDPDALSEALNRLVTETETRNRLTEKAREWALDHTSLDSMGNRIISLMS